MNKLTALHINIIGIVTALIMSLLLFFLMIKPKNEDIETAQKATEAAESAGGTQAKITEAQNTLKKEQQTTVVKTKAWAVNQKAYMPRMEFGPNQKSSNMLGLYEFGGIYSNNKRYGMRDFAQVWGPKVRNWYDAHVREGIIRTNDFPIEAFSTNPNDISKLTSITVPQGKPWHVTVLARSFDAAMLHLRRFNSMRGFGMPVIDNVSLEGQSPALALTYDMSLYIIPPADPPAPDPIIAGDAGAGAGSASGPGSGGFGAGNLKYGAASGVGK